jgi:hypothetical protein
MRFSDRFTPGGLPSRPPTGPTRLGWLVLIAVGVAGGLLLLPRDGPARDGLDPLHTETDHPTDVAPPVPDVVNETIDRGGPAESLLKPGDVMVLASWRCSFPRLAEVNEVALQLIEPPLTRLTEAGQLIGWGQFNGEFRDEYNYHTYYIAERMEDYRRAIGQVLNHMNRDVPELMTQFYQLCSMTRETRITVVTARP